MRQGPLLRSGATGAAAAATSWLIRLVVIQGFVGAVLWLLAAAAAVDVSLLSASDLVLGLAVAVGVVVLIWRMRWIAGMKDKKQVDLERQLEIERGRGDRLAAALDVISGLSHSPLEVGPGAGDQQTTNWLASSFFPAIQRLVPDVGLGIVRMEDGVYTLVSDVGVPDIVRMMLPKRTDRHLSDLFAALLVENSIQLPLPTRSNYRSPEWLVIFCGSELDEPANTVLAVGIRMISDARRGPCE